MSAYSKPHVPPSPTLPLASSSQSEVAIDDTVDMLMLLLSPAAGDELQGIKKGIMEHADLIAINKSDGEFVGSAQHMQADIRSALQVIRRRWGHWKPKVRRCSALLNEGMEDLWQLMQDFRTGAEDSGEVSHDRALVDIMPITSQRAAKAVGLAGRNSTC